MPKWTEGPPPDTEPLVGLQVKALDDCGDPFTILIGEVDGRGNDLSWVGCGCCADNPTPRAAITAWRRLVPAVERKNERGWTVLEVAGE